MAAEKALKAILDAAGAVTALVEDRIYPVERREGSDLPALVYQQISGQPTHDVTGPIGYVPARYQITCWAATYLEACDLAEAVRDAVDGYSGTIAELAIDHVFVLDEGDMPSLAADNRALSMHGKRLDVLIVFTE